MVVVCYDIVNLYISCVNDVDLLFVKIVMN